MYKEKYRHTHENATVERNKMFRKQIKRKKKRKAKHIVRVANSRTHC